MEWRLYLASLLDSNRRKGQQPVRTWQPPRGRFNRSRSSRSRLSSFRNRGRSTCRAHLPSVCREQSPPPALPLLHHKCSHRRRTSICATVRLKKSCQILGKRQSPILSTSSATRKRAADRQSLQRRMHASERESRSAPRHTELAASTSRPVGLNSRHETLKCGIFNCPGRNACQPITNCFNAHNPCCLAE